MRQKYGTLGGQAQNAVIKFNQLSSKDCPNNDFH